MFFWCVITLLCVVVLAAYRRTQDKGAQDHVDDKALAQHAAWQVLLRQREELEADVRVGELSDEHRAEALREWAIKAGATVGAPLTAAGASEVASSGRLDAWLSWASVGIVLTSICLYLLLGSPQALHLASTPPPVATVANAVSWANRVGWC